MGHAFADFFTGLVGFHIVCLGLRAACMHRPAANHSTAACTCTEFCKSHLDGHSVDPTFTYPIAPNNSPGARSPVEFLMTCRSSGIPSSRLTLIITIQEQLTKASRQTIWLMSHLGAVWRECSNGIRNGPVTPKAIRPKGKGWWVDSPGRTQVSCVIDSPIPRIATPDQDGLCVAIGLTIGPLHRSPNSRLPVASGM